MMFSQLEDTRDVLFAVLQDRSLPLTLRISVSEQLTESYQNCIEEGRQFDIDDLLRECERHQKEGSLSEFISKHLSEKGADAASLHQWNRQKKELQVLRGLERLRPEWNQILDGAEKWLYQENEETYKNICKEFKTGNLVQKALDNVSLNLRDSEFVAILGPSGSGKTTLLNIIGGLDHYDKGDLIINKISTKNYKDRDWDSYRNHTIGFVFQSYNLIPHQTILANVELALTISGVPRSKRKAKAMKALEQVGLASQAHKKPNQLSGGQMQRVAIARALVNDPDIVLADEPTGALDSETSVQVMELLKEVAKDRLVVMVTHNPELAEEYATRIVNLKDGVICSDTNPYMIENEKEEKAKHKNMGKTSMSIFTSLLLSFNNLKTKKGRTALVSFAGSIGIIGIALILSLSNGVNNYIKSIEEETLSEYPIQIQSTGIDISSMLVSDQNDGKSNNEDNIKVTSKITNMFSKMGANDLASLKQYLDSDESGLKNYAKDVEYSYNVKPIIYSSNTQKLRQVNPDKSFSGLGIGSSSSQNSLMSSMMSTDRKSVV